MVYSLSLGLGEASYAFSCDDRAARREAGLLDVKLTGTLGILKKAVRQRIINLSGGDRILVKMIQSGFYSPVKSMKEI